MPRTPGREWAVARFLIDNMHSNDNHLKVLDPDQQYERFSFILNGDLKPDSVIELAWVVVWRGKDEEPPSVPTDFAVTRNGDKVMFKWKPSLDNLAVSHYEIMRKRGGATDRVTVATLNLLETSSRTLVSGVYFIRAVDVAGNVSPVSNSAEF